MRVTAVIFLTAFLGLCFVQSVSAQLEADLVVSDQPIDPGIEYEPRKPYDEVRWFVPSRAFDPIQADPRWPRFEFGTAYVLESEGEFFGEGGPYDNLWLVAFGENIAFYAGPPPESMSNLFDTIEIGAVAALFATFDLLEESVPLLNADYNGGIFFAGRKGPWSTFIRLFHESSHLGDELLLFGPEIDRDDQTFDSIEAFISRDFRNVADMGTIRIYGGAGWLFRTFGTPDYGDFVFQYGAEFDGTRMRYNLPGGLGVRPTAAIDMQHLDGRGYNFDFSVSAGARFDGLRRGGQTDLEIIYYNGRNQNGQLFVDDIEYLGVSLRLYL
ncbi:MAG: DUF1207 domain-containing protein [Planctomycetota bacterium]